ncbi:FAD dependent oxidoreductase [Colletotrichum graminicola]|uniref:FAD dependent oxidoreductase n=1 Tax=Colletotrichum graminicola (strain M1.001 / M2 / FGSC 10212) TaxID=645133 RepID=E3QAS8_COLGM|nr:FAD dependent oxidoreductase [Colletotrichum graminicola M1.001]EFQ27966.1 FAD dependent oxidoreductase [Colletotrichum graminicola M1.001]WDK12105.1 FAD dependent oxidoreductase [Colletotrichum graminicola]
MPAVGKKAKAKTKTKTKTKKQRREKSLQLAAARIIKEALIPPSLPVMDPQAKRNIVIVGGGIIGSTTAYFLTRHPKYNPALHRITLLEATAVASGASGKAGGLLALWAYPQCLVPLSYRLHKELAAEHGGEKRWGYRRVNCGSFEARVTKQMLERPRQAVAKPEAVAPGANDGEQEKGWERLPKQDDAAEAMLEESVLPRDLDWVDRDAVESYAEMGMPGATETAQVHPYLFTTSMAALAQDKGVEIRTNAQLTAIASSGEGVTGVEYLDRESGETCTIEGVTDVLVSAGPWTGRLLPASKVTGLRAHSVVYNANVSPYAVFTSIKLPADFVPEHRASKGQKRKHKRVVDPEIYARPDGEVYACGEPDENAPLPETADKVQVDEANCDDIISYIATVSPVLVAAPIKAKQACYLPQHDSGPLIGATSVPGLWLAAGHTCWGIQNGPATGKLMSEYILDGKPTSSDISSLDPRRFKV